MRSSLLVALAACGAAPVSPTHNEVVEHVPRVELAVATGETVRVMHTTDTGIVVDRTVEPPAIVSAIVWAGAAPIVWLDLPVDEYRHYQAYNGLTGTSKQRFFAGCEPIANYEWAMTGPADTIWVAGKKLEVYWHDRKIGESERGEVAFRVD